MMNLKNDYKKEYLKVNDISKADFSNSKWHYAKFYKVIYIMILNQFNIDSTFRYGYKYFYKDKFKITKGVFVPQFDTEQIVEIALKGKEGLEVGTGSGVISITLQKYFNKNMTAIDINEKAVKLSKTNCKNLDVNLNIINVDIKEYFPNHKFDFIVSNPPYVQKGDPEVSKWVKKNQPSDALYEESENEFYYYILENWNRFLNDDGEVLFEIGYNNFRKLNEYLEINKYSYEFFNDYNNIKRFVKIWK